MLKKDKKKVIGEDMTDAQIAHFINYSPASPNDETDFLTIQSAYRGLRLHDFERFLTGFVARGGNLEAKDRHGQTMLEHIATHAKGADYLTAIKNKLNA